jgi:hypothetical protein
LYFSPHLDILGELGHEHLYTLLVEEVEIALDVDVIQLRRVVVGLAIGTDDNDIVDRVVARLGHQPALRSRREGRTMASQN